MRINIYDPTYTHICANRNKYNNSSIPSFQGKTSFVSRKIVRRAIPLAVSLLMLLGGINSCFSSKKLSGKENLSGVDFEYYNVNRDYKNEIYSAYCNFKSKLDNDNDFLDGVKLIYTGKNSYLEDDYSFKSFLKSNNAFSDIGGVSYYSDKNIPSVIVLQEYPHTLREDLATITRSGSKSILPFLKHSLFHEIGHQFDEYFGHDHNAKFARDFDSLMYIREQDPEDNPYMYACRNQAEYDIIAQYTLKNGLSDRAEFVDAVTKDFQQIAIMQKTTPGYLPDNISYYTQGIDLSKPITINDIEMADIARNEVFASLFSYALGQNDGDRSLFLRTFSNSYPIVVQYIKEYLGKNVFNFENK